MKTKKFALAPNANTDHASARDMYDAYGWHLDTKHCGSVMLQVVDYDWLDKPDAEVVDRLIHDDPELHRAEAREIVAQAREIRVLMNVIEEELSDAVAAYECGDVDATIKALEAASKLEKEHGDDPETRALRAKLIVEVDDDEDEKAAPVVEVCSNVEWLTEYWAQWPDRIDPAYVPDAAGELQGELRRRLRKAGYEDRSARGERRLLHGWNGAHFKHVMGPVGSFADLTDAQVAVIEGIVAAVARDVLEAWAEKAAD